MIEEKIKQVLNFQVAVVLRTPGELQQVIKDNPFVVEKGIDTDKLYVTFLSSVPDESALSKMNEIRGEPDRFIAMNKEIYLYCPNGYGSTKFSNNFFERKLGVIATTRNWKTVNTLQQIAINHSSSNIS